MDLLPYRIAIALVALTATRFWAQAPSPVTIGNFENTGFITAGYRFVDVHGYRPKYEELFDLNPGFRVTEVGLYGSVKEGTQPFADGYSLTLSGLGGDPFATAQLTARKTNLYDLRVSYLQSYYYWNRNDNVFSNGFTAITSNHDWATVRKLGSANLSVTATPNLRFTLEYFRNSRDGTTFTTRPMDYFGSSSAWGAFARANPYYLMAPLNEMANRIAGGVDYTRRNWNFHYRIGYQVFDDSVNGRNLGPGQRSINTNDPATAKELLNFASWTDFRKLNSPVSQFLYDDKINRHLEFHGGYTFYRYGGPASLNFSANGTARTNSAGTAFAPYEFAMSASAMNTEPNHIVDQGLSYRLNDTWRLFADYRYSRLDVESTGHFQSIASGVTASGISANAWRIGTSILDLRGAFTPSPSLLVNAGVRLMKNDVEFLDTDLADPTRTKRIKTLWPMVSAYYQPAKWLSFRGDIEQTTTGTFYTRISPHTDFGGRLVVHVHPLEKLSFDDSLVIRNLRLVAADYRSSVRGNSSTVTWEWTPRLDTYAGFSYESFFASDFTTFLRGTAPLTDAIRDQTVSRIWQGGIHFRPFQHLTLNFTGNYTRTNGLGEISGEPPLYGPVTFPYASGSIQYSFPRWGALGLQLQRTYYIEQIITANNFSANLLLVNWTWSF